MTEAKTFNYPLERLDPEIRYGYSLLFEADRLINWIDGLTETVVIREKSGLLTPKPKQKAELDLNRFLASKRQEGIGWNDEGELVLGVRINQATGRVEEIRVNPWDLGQVRSLLNGRNILNVAGETFDRCLQDFEDSPTIANKAAQHDSLALVKNAVGNLYQPKVIKREDPK